MSNDSLFSNNDIQSGFSSSTSSSSVLDGGVQKKLSKVDVSYKQIEEAIVLLRLAPGSVISEQEIADLTGIGRTPVREAVQKLSHEGLITVLPKRGLLITPLDVLNHMKLIEARRTFEELVCRCACRRATDEERTLLRQYAVIMRQTVNDDDRVLFGRIDKDFNDLCIVAARNEFAEKAMRTVSGLSRRFWHYYQEQFDDWHGNALSHANLADAIAEGDIDATREALTHLLDQVELFVRNLLTRLS